MGGWVFALKFLYQGNFVGTFPGNTSDSQQCPAGQRITGVRTWCGSVMDGIQFYCSLPVVVPIMPSQKPTGVPTQIPTMVTAGWMPLIGRLHETSYSLLCSPDSWIDNMEGRVAYPWIGLAQFTATCSNGVSLGSRCGSGDASPYSISDQIGMENGIDQVYWETSSNGFVFSLKFLYQGNFVGTFPGNPTDSQQCPAGQRITGVRTYCGKVMDAIQFYCSWPAIPSMMPARIPTEVPTQIPTGVPTQTPTMNPSKMQSSEPTGVPTMIRSKMPSSKPTEVPAQPSKKSTDVISSTGENVYMPATVMLSVLSIVLCGVIFLQRRNKKRTPTFEILEFAEAPGKC